MSTIDERCYMIDFLQDMETIETLTLKYDNYIWGIFRRYIKQEGILFSSPDDWSYRGDSIYFNGLDSCMGCYDNMSLDIPIQFFINPDIEFDNLIKQREQEKINAKNKNDELIKKIELQEYERLRQKYS